MHLMKRDAGDIIYDGMQVGARAVAARIAPRHADGVSGQLRLAQSAPDHRGIDRVRPEGAWHGGCGRARAGARTARQGGLAAGNLRQPLSARDFRRPAPARQYRARAGAVAAAGDPRRGGVGAGQIGRGAGAQSAGRSQARVRPDLSVHQPRSQRGALHLRPRAGDVSRRGRRARPGRPGLGCAGASLYAGAAGGDAVVRSRQPHRDAADLGRSAESDRSAVRAAGFTPAVRLRSRSAQMPRQNSRDVDTMGHEAACYMAIPGSGHSRAPAKEKEQRMQHDKTRPQRDQGDGRRRRRARRPPTSPRASPIPSARRSKALRRLPARCRSISSPRPSCWCRTRRCRNERPNPP